MTKLRCCFCQQKLGIGSIDRKWLVCFNCHITGDDKLWQELIRTRKALEVAKDKLDTVRQYHRGTAVIRPNDIAAYCDRALEQITALTKGGDNE